jgi:hypothetical protein
LKVLLNVSIVRFANDSAKVFDSGEVVDLPSDEAERMIILGRAIKFEEPEPEVVPVAPKPKLASKRGA